MIQARLKFSSLYNYSSTQDWLIGGRLLGTAHDLIGTAQQVTGKLMPIPVDKNKVAHTGKDQHSSKYRRLERRRSSIITIAEQRCPNRIGTPP